jgi:hypothetical protein
MKTQFHGPLLDGVRDNGVVAEVEKGTIFGGRKGPGWPA